MPKKKLPKVDYKPLFLTIKDNTLTFANPGDQLISFKEHSDGTVEFFPTKSKKNVAAKIKEGYVLINFKDGAYINIEN